MGEFKDIPEPTINIASFPSNSVDNNSGALKILVVQQGSSLSQLIVKRQLVDGIIDGTNTIFTIPDDIITGSEEIFWNGVLLDEGPYNDYTMLGSQITLARAPKIGQKILVNYIKQNP